MAISSYAELELPPQPFPCFTVRDGRYLGTAGRWWVEVRIDACGSGVISIDLHSSGVGHDVAPSGAGRSAPTLIEVSARTRPLERIDATAGRWALRWSLDEHEASGWFAARQVPDVPDSYVLRLALVESLGDPLKDGIGPQVIVVRVTRVGDALRDLGIEVEVEAGVVPPQAVVMEGDSLDVASRLARSGFAVTSAGAPTVIARPEGGTWHGADVLEQLHRTMTQAAQSTLAAPSWEARLLLLSRSDRKGLLGVMFDFADDLPRQGAAVFVDEIRDRYPQSADRRILQASLHELGHVLNLAHRFSIGRWDSPSVMNYPSCFKMGGHDADYEAACRFEYDIDELEFLRHGRRQAVVPGGAPFGSAEYWLAEGAVPEVPSAEHLRLWLTPPEAMAGAGAVTITPGQPVFLGVSIGNAGADPVVVPRWALDLKAGHLTLQLTRRGGLARPFAPILQRCYDPDRPRLVRLDRGQSLHDNINLSFGSGGLPFVEPGEYEVRPVLELPTGGPGGGEGVVRITGGSLGITVEAPGAQHAAELQLLGRPDVGAGLVLASTALTTDAHAAITELRSRRYAAAGQGHDPVAPVVDRVLGIEAGRRGDRAVAAAGGDPAAGREAHAEARRLLDQAVAGGEGATFDPHTREHTRRLSARYAALASRGQEREAPRVIVDFGWPGPAGARGAVRTPGVLRVNRAGQGWAVVTPARGVPPEALSGGLPVDAVVTLAGSDGLSERMTVPRIDLVSSGPDRSPEIALLWLPRPVPGTTTPVLRPTLPNSTITAGRTLWDILDRDGVAPTQFAHDDEPEALAPWAAAADVALADGDVDAAEQASVHAVFVTFADVAWGCHTIRACDEDGKGDGSHDSDMPYPFSPDHPFDVRRDRPDDYPSSSQTSA